MITKAAVVAMRTYGGSESGRAVVVAPEITGVAGTGRLPGRYTWGRSEVHDNHSQGRAGDDDNEEGQGCVSRPTRAINSSIVLLLRGWNRVKQQV